MLRDQFAVNSEAFPRTTSLSINLEQGRPVIPEIFSVMALNPHSDKVIIDKHAMIFSVPQRDYHSQIRHVPGSSQ